MGSARRVRATVALHGLAAVLGIAPCAWADGSDYHESVPAPAVPRWLSLPFEWGHDAAWVRGSQGPVYRAMIGLLPGVQLGSVGLQAALQGHYRNPGFDAGLGGHATWLLARGLGGLLALRVFGEAVYLPVRSGADIGAGLKVGAGNLVYLAILGGGDTDREVGFFGVRIGVELPALADPVGAITYFSPSADLAVPSR